jgi:hypothetical protein
MRLCTGLCDKAQAQIVALKDTARAGLKIERRHACRVTGKTQGPAEMKWIAHQLSPNTGIAIRVLNKLDKSLRLENGCDRHNNLLSNETNGQTAHR